MENIKTEEKMKNLKDFHKLTVAPMMAITNPHFRYFMRLLTKRVGLYTEMLHHDVILNSKFGYKKDLYFNIEEGPIIIQLGGNDPEKLQECARLCKEMGYDEINLNCGCPSSRVAAGNFGACLMRNPELVAKCCKAMRDETQMEITVKCRLGLDIDDDDFLNDFINTVSSQGQVDHFIMHARLALMNLDTDKNRKIPPLQYSKVYDLSKSYKDLLFSINGGIKTIEDTKALLDEGYVKGVMIGRAAYDNPWIFGNADKEIFGVENPGLSRKEILYNYAEYCDFITKKYNENEWSLLPQELLKPLTNLFNGEKFNSVYRHELNTPEIFKKYECLSDHIKTVIEVYEKTNPEAMNKKFE